ncbi:MAG: menaquinone biosynthesis protein [Bacteroidales bacterium]|nr:menaquinone biosynthesis protein [Bacteroidales bacterium]
MVRIAAINYLNTIPFLYGLETCMSSGTIDMQYCTPAVSAALLREGKADVGIMPVGALPDLDNPSIVADYCIGATGPVASVLVVSGRPIEEVDEILLDVDSRTSVLLTRYLCREKWHIAPRFEAFDFSRETLDTRRCYLLIGDKALLHGGEFRYVYDLASEWIALKQLPFVFACWTASRPLEPSFIEKFNQALEYGISHIPEAIEKYNHQFPREYACRYLRDNISFPLDSEKRAGLSEFRRVALEKLTPRECVC